MKRLAVLILSLLVTLGAFQLAAHDPDEAKSLDQVQAEKQKAQGKAKAKGGKQKGQRPKGKQVDLEAPVEGLAPGAIQGELPAEEVPFPGAQADFPAIAVTQDGDTWVACLEWNREQRDRVVVRRRPAGGDWGEPIELQDGCWEHYAPALAPRGDSVLVVWPGHNDRSFDLYACEIAASGKPGAVRQLTKTNQSDFNVQAAADAEGNVTIAWQSFRNQQSDVFAQRLAGETWGEAVRVSPSQNSDWEPVVAVDSSGAAWIAWDTYDRGNYDVMLRKFTAAGLGPATPITTEPSAQFHATLAVDANDRIWIAWDDAGINWGKDFSRSSGAPGSRGLHYSRTLEVRVLEDGTLKHPTAELNKILTGRMERFAELPCLRCDKSGALWLVFRHWTTTKPHEMFHFYATRLSDEGWTRPWLLSKSAGRNTQHPGTAIDSAGQLQVVYSSDGRAPGHQAEDRGAALGYRTYLAALPNAPAAVPLELANVKLPEPQPVASRRERAAHQLGTSEYTLLFGDCHRHTDIRGHSGVDASALDTYRYGIDAAQLDFLGLGDHNQVTLNWPDGLRDYQWWYQQKFVDLFTHAPTFFGIYSYEHSLSRPAGHRNMLHLKRGAPMRPANRDGGGQVNPDNQPPNLWAWVEANVLTQPGQQIIIVPHTFAAGPLADWNWPNARFDCLLEIYQGCRGSYEAWRLPRGEKRGPTQTDDPGHFARDALDKGNVYGFVSFSDHASTHNSWAGVWVKEPTREGIFEAMRARRTFGASDEIVLRVGAEDRSAQPRKHYAVGELIEAPATQPLTLTIDVTAPDKLLRVDVIKNGKYVYTKEPDGRTFQATYTDMEAEPGRAYYYVRVFQRDPEDPTGDPEIAWASPLFVTYK